MHFGATSDQIMEVAYSSCNIQSASNSTSLWCEDNINERRIDSLVTSWGVNEIMFCIALHHNTECVTQIWTCYDQ